MSLVTLGHLRKRTTNSNSLSSEGADYFRRCSDADAATKNLALLQNFPVANSEVLETKTQSGQHQRNVISRNVT